MNCNKFLLFFLVICFGCGGGLSEKQRKALKQEMESREIRKISEEEIVAEAFTIGQKLYKNHLAGYDSLTHKMKAKLYIINKNDSVRNKLEWELLEAYKYSLTTGAKLTNNVQRDGEEMIYTVPFIKEDEFMGIYVIRIPRKELVINL